MDLSPMLVASFHRFRVDIPQALPFCNQLLHALQRRPVASEGKKFVVRLNSNYKQLLLEMVYTMYLLFLGMGLDQKSRFPTIKYQNSTYLICWRIAKRKKKSKRIL